MKALQLQEDLEDILHRDGKLSEKNLIIYETVVYLNGISIKSPIEYSKK